MQLYIKSFTSLLLKQMTKMNSQANISHFLAGQQTCNISFPFSEIQRRRLRNQSYRPSPLSKPALIRTHSCQPLRTKTANRRYKMLHRSRQLKRPKSRCKNRRKNRRKNRCKIPRLNRRLNRRKSLLLRFTKNLQVILLVIDFLLIQQYYSIVSYLMKLPCT